MRITDIRDQSMGNLIAAMAISGLLATNILLPLIVQTDDLLAYYAWSMLIGELLVLYLPARILTRVMGGNAKTAQIPVKFSAYSIAALLGISLIFLAGGLNSILAYLYDMLGLSPMGAVIPSDTGWRMWASIILLSLVPAFAEESLFRGALLSAYKSLGARRAMWRTALLFSLLHAQPHYLPTFLLISFVLSHITLRTGSCYPAMVVHAVYNGGTMLLSYMSSAADSGTSLQTIDLTVLMLSVFSYVAIGAGLLLLSNSLLKRVCARGVTKPIPVEDENDPVPDRASAIFNQPGQKKVMRAPIIVAYSLLIAMNVLFFVYSLPIWGATP